MSLIEKIDTVMHQMGLNLKFVCDAYDRSLEPRPPMVRGAQVIENVHLPEDFDPPSASPIP